MDVGAGGLPRDPPGRSVARGHLAVQGGRHLPRHEGKSRANVFRVGKVLTFDLIRQHASVDLHSRGLERPEPLPVHDRVGVASPGDQRGDSRIQECSGAGRRPAEVIAGFQRAEHRRARGLVARIGEGHRFRVRGTGALVPSLADDSTVTYDHGADARPGPAPAPCMPRRPRANPLPGQDGQRRSGRPNGRTLVLSHPDSHGRSRNCAGSTSSWRLEGRGLSPPVGSCTPPRRRASPAKYRGARRLRKTRFQVARRSSA